MQDVLRQIKEFYLGALTKEQDMKKLQGNKDHSPVWVYQYNYKHNHSLAYFDPVNPGQVRRPELKSLDRATHAHEVSMMAPMFEKEMGPLSTQEVEQSKKF